MVASLTRRTQVAFCSAVTAYFSTMLKARSPCSWSATMWRRKKVTSSSVKPYFSMSGGVVLEYTTGTCDSRPTLIAAIASTNGRRDCRQHQLCSPSVSGRSRSEERRVGKEGRVRWGGWGEEEKRGGE